MTDLKAQIRHVPDFPKAGILFYDITTLLKEPAGLRAASAAAPSTTRPASGPARPPRARAGR